MNLFISTISNIGDLSRERLVIRAAGEVDLGRFAVFCCWARDADGVASGEVPSAFWFEDLVVKEGDLVVLYTKTGTRSEKLREDGKTSHFFYWHKDESIWTRDKRAVLVSTPSWALYEGASSG